MTFIGTSKKTDYLKGVRTITTAITAAALTLALGQAACGRGAEQKPAESTAAATAQQLDISLATNPAAVTTGSSQVDVTVLDAGKPVTDANVTLELHMPPSGAMGEMRTGSELKSAGDGHYRGSVDVMMAGKWDATVRVKRGGQVVATHTQPLTVQ
jgi:hypothetical protein